MESNNQPNYTHTVHCYTDRTRRRHFEGIEAATAYANDLLRQGEKAKIFPYRPPRRYVDIVAERGPNG